MLLGRREDTWCMDRSCIFCAAVIKFRDEATTNVRFNPSSLLGSSSADEINMHESRTRVVLSMADEYETGRKTNDHKSEKKTKYSVGFAP